MADVEPTASAEGTTEGGEGNEFIQTLGDGFQGNEALSGFDSADTLAQGYLDLAAKNAELAQQVDAAPKPPESHDQYSAVELDGVEVNQELVDGFKVVAHDLGLSDEAYKAVLGYQLEAVAKFDAQINEQGQAMKAELEKEWGSNAEANLLGVRQVIEKYGIEDLLNSPDETGAALITGNNPLMVKFLHKISTELSADRLPGDGSGATGDNRPRTDDGQPMFEYKDMPD